MRHTLVLAILLDTFSHPAASSWPSIRSLARPPTATSILASQTSESPAAA